MRLIPVLTAALVAAVFYFWIIGKNTDAAETDTPTPTDTAQAEVKPVPVVALRSKTRTVESAVILRGQTEAFRKVELRAQVTGLVTTEPRRAGAQIKAGDVLCEIDAGEKTAALDEAQARLKEAEVRQKASTQLVQRGFAAETKALNDMSALNSAQYAVRRAELEISRLKLTAPFDGVLETDTAELGSLMQPGSHCATVIALDPIKLVGFLPESEVDKIEVGGVAGAELSTGQRVMGTVTFVSSSADPLTRTFRVEITAENTDSTIRDGLSAQIALPLSGILGHLLPQASLTLDDAGRLGVRLVVDGKAQFQAVSIVRDSAEGIWVTGLPDAADVIVVGQEFVSDGRLVEPSYTEEGAI